MDRFQHGYEGSDVLARRPRLDGMYAGSPAVGVVRPGFFGEAQGTPGNSLCNDHEGGRFVPAEKEGTRSVRN
eukprot:6509383-Prymnesium_polylepis.1